MNPELRSLSKKKFQASAQTPQHEHNQQSEYSIQDNPELEFLPKLHSN